MTEHFRANAGHGHLPHAPYLEPFIKRLRVLIVEDSVLDAELLVQALTSSGYEIVSERVDTEDAMRSALESASWDVVLSDYHLLAFSGLEALGVLQVAGHRVPLIIVSGTIGEETAVQALKAGADDFLSKGRLARLAPAIERELREASLRVEREELEEQLRQAQKMEAIGRLAGSVAHDFNNMLTSILGYAELLIDQIGADKPFGQDLREIRASANRAAALTRQLLAFSRKQVLANTPVNLTEVVRTLVPMLRRLLGERIKIETRLADDLYIVVADVMQVEHLMVNLAVNARDAMPDGGVLTIATGNVELDEHYVATHLGSSVGPFACLSMSDTGTGMTTEVLAKIFEPFFTTKDRGQGTGLGLAAVYGTVKQLGGYIEASSEPGRGSAFRICLPRTDRTLEMVQGERPVGLCVGSETVLLVEDEPGVRSFVGTVLKRFGYRVLEAESAEAALLAIEGAETSIDLLLTDVVLPGMSGPQFAHLLNKGHSELAVLFMSGYADDRALSDVEIAERGGWIEKPFFAQALLAKIRDVLGEKAGRIQ